MRSLTRTKTIVIGVCCTLLAVFVIHEAFPRRSSSLKAWLDLLVSTRPGEILASSEQDGHYVAIERTTDDRAIVWVRHSGCSSSDRAMGTSVGCPGGSLCDEERQEGNEVIHLGPRELNGLAVDGEGSAFPIKRNAQGELGFRVWERAGADELLNYCATVAWR